MKKWISLLFSTLMLCSYSIEAAELYPYLTTRGSYEGTGTVKRIAFNKYQVLNGIYSNSDLKKFYIVTKGNIREKICNLQGTFKAAIADARAEYGAPLTFIGSNETHIDLEAKVLCHIKYDCYGSICGWVAVPGTCCLINKVITK